MALERLQKIISRAGVASRRKAEEFITQGRVTVNGETVSELGAKADFSTDHVKVDGRLLRPPSELIYLALNKPRGYVTTVSDPEGRPTVMDLMKKVKGRFYPVGRLDFNSEGLLLITNDGEFANRVTSASSEIQKTYWVKVKGSAQEKDIDKLRHGILLDGQRTLPSQIRILKGVSEESAPVRQRTAERSRAFSSFSARGAVSALRAATANSWCEVILSEGRQNQIRRMFDLIGHPVLKLKRIRIGSVTLGKLPPGKFRQLTPIEIARLLGQKKPARIRSITRNGSLSR